MVAPGETGRVLSFNPLVNVGLGDRERAGFVLGGDFQQGAGVVGAEAAQEQARGLDGQGQLAAGFGAGLGHDERFVTRSAFLQSVNGGGGKRIHFPAIGALEIEKRFVV